jgi:hypothetical protein
MNAKNLTWLTPRRSALALLALLGVAVLAGCMVTSVYPYYTERDVVFDPALSGVWADAGSTNTARENWQFERAEGKSFKLTVRDANKTTEYAAHLFKLGGHMFIDAASLAEQDDFIPPHYLLKVSHIEPELEMFLMDFNWLKDLLKEKPDAIRHIWVGQKWGKPDSGRPVLTADTAELQAFVLKHVDDTNAFSHPLVMKRR